MRYFILEHPTRGTLRDLEETDSGHVGRFSASGSRADDETAMRFATVPGALAARQRLPAMVATKTQVRQSPGEGQFDWPVVA